MFKFRYMHLMKTFLVIFLMMINIEGYPNDKDIEESINFKNMKKFRGRSSSFDSGAATASPTAAVKELDQVKSDLTVCKNELANCQSSLQNLRTIQQSACPESSVEMNEQLITCQKSLLGTNKQIVCLNNYRQLSIRMFNRLKLQMSRLTEASGISNAESLDLIIPLSKLWASIDTGLMEKDDQCLLFLDKLESQLLESIDRSSLHDPDRSTAPSSFEMSPLKLFVPFSFVLLILYYLKFNRYFTLRNMFILLVLFGFVYEYLLLIEQKQLEIKQSERAYYRDCEETIEKDWWSRLSSWYSKSSESDCNRVELQISVNTFLHVNPVLVPFSLLRRMLSSLLLGLGHTSGIEIASFLKQFTLTQSIWITLLFAIFIFVFLNSFPAILVNFVYAFYSLYANRNSHILFRSAYFEQTQHSLQPIANDNATRRLAVRRRPVHHPIRMNRYPSYRIKNTNHLRIKALQSPSSNSHS